MTDHDHDLDDGAVHAHIAPTKFYVGIFGTLVLLTMLTVGVSYVHLGPANLAVAIVIASIKASLVVMFFMHLKYDTRFNALIFVCSLMFIGVFFAYTFNDTEHRGQVDSANGTHVLPQNGQIAPGGMEVKPEATGNGPGMEHAPGIEPGKGTPPHAGEKLAPQPGPKDTPAVPEKH